MKSKSVALGMFAGLCAVAAASQASATIVNVTVTGTITQVDQVNGGSPLNSAQIGEAYKAVYTFDTTQAGPGVSEPGLTQDLGGSEESSGPFGHVDVTIGDQSYSFDGSVLGQITSEANCSGSSDCMYQAVDSRNGTADAFDEIVSSTTEFGTFPVDFATPGSYDLFFNVDGQSSGILRTRTLSNGMLITTGQVFAELQHIEISDGNAVPEPASLSLFAAGLMGAPFFRRRGGKQA